MIYANKTSKFAKKILSNCLILQFSATQTILFCIFSATQTILFCNFQQLKPSYFAYFATINCTKKKHPRYLPRAARSASVYGAKTGISVNNFGAGGVRRYNTKKAFPFKEGLGVGFPPLRRGFGVLLLPFLPPCTGGPRGPRVGLLAAWVLLLVLPNP